jgi:hypothetical protein
MGLAPIGKFRSEGRDSDGRSFRGSAEIREAGAFNRIILDHEGREPLHGLGKREGSNLAFALGPRDKVEIGVYELSGENLRGLWVPPDIQVDADQSVCGREFSVRSGENEYTIKEARSITGETYDGRIRIHPVGDANAAGVRPVKMQWILADGTFNAVALQSDSMLFAAFSFEPEAMHGVVLYKLVDEGYQGTWFNNKGEQGTDVLMRE